MERIKISGFGQTCVPCGTSAVHEHTVDNFGRVIAHPQPECSTTETCDHWVVVAEASSYFGNGVAKGWRRLEDDPDVAAEAAAWACHLDALPDDLSRIELLRVCFLTGAQPERKFIPAGLVLALLRQIQGVLQDPEMLAAFVACNRKEGKD